MERSAHIENELARWVDLKRGSIYTMRLRIVDVVNRKEGVTQSTLVIGDGPLNRAFAQSGGAPPTFHTPFVFRFNDRFISDMDFFPKAKTPARLTLEMFRGAKDPLPIDDITGRIGNPFVITWSSEEDFIFKLAFA